MLENSKKQANPTEDLSPRARLYVHNKTHLSPTGQDDGNGRYLQVRWFGREVHEGDHTELIPFGRQKFWKSTQVQYGNNKRKFNVTIKREYFGDIKEILTFTHSVSNPVGAAGQDYFEVFKDFKANGDVQITVKILGFDQPDRIVATKIVSQKDWLGQ